MHGESKRMGRRTYTSPAQSIDSFTQAHTYKLGAPPRQWSGYVRSEENSILAGRRPVLSCGCSLRWCANLTHRRVWLGSAAYTAYRKGRFSSPCKFIRPLSRTRYAGLQSHSFSRPLRGQHRQRWSLPFGQYHSEVLGTFGRCDGSVA